MSFLCKRDADPCWAVTITSAASLNKASLSSILISIFVPLSSEMYSGSWYALGYAFWEPIKSVNNSISGVSTNAHWILTNSFPWVNSISPLPINWSAPELSKIVLESIFEVTLNAILAGKFALITPVITLTEGLCVAIIKWIPIALANCANLAIGVSTSLPAVIIKSANSSTTKTTYGKNLWSSFGFSFLSLNFLLYSTIFLQEAFFKSSYLLSISMHNEFNVLITFLLSVIIASSLSGSLAK